MVDAIYLENFCKNGDTKNLHEMAEDTKNFIIEVAPHVFRKYPSEINKYRKRVLLVLSYILMPMPYPTIPFKPGMLEWENNSCYMDSVFFAMFAVPNEFIDQNILNVRLKKRERPSCFSKRLLMYEKQKQEPPANILERMRVQDLKYRMDIQKELVKIATTLRGGGGKKQMCSLIREKFALCNPLETYETGRMQDSGEFLGALLQLFDLNKATEKTTDYVGNSPDQLLPIESKIYPTNIMWSISAFQLMGLGNRITRLYDYVSYTEVNQRVKKFNGKFYQYTGLSNTLISSQYVVFNINRRGLGGMITSPIVPQEMMILGNNDVGYSIYMHISSVVFRSQHYMAYIKNGDDWYFYNDINTVYKKIGNYDKLLRANPSVVTSGTQHFYTRLADF